MIPQAFIQDLLARVDIVDVVGRAVKLRKAGANFLGLCPFHGEKTPSFTVSPTKQFYYCFGCGKHGSAIGFLMDHGGLGYVDAVSELARSLGLQVPQEPGGPTADPRVPGLVELNARAARWYCARLRDSREAIEYLKGRGLEGRTAARYAIGFAPDQWRGLEAAVPDYDAEEMVTAGLVIAPEGESSDGRRRRYDRFRGRIMFPIRNGRGQVIGFGGRILGAGEPKYLNSPETPLFSKGRELYGLFEAREAIRREQTVIVVEGYMDVVMLAQHGVTNVVATLGTATTGDHVRTLQRLAARLVFAFDGDAAGRKAAWRALEASLPQASDSKAVQFLFLPAEHDPDSFVRERGADGLRAALVNATPLSELLLSELAQRCGTDTPEQRAALMTQAAPLLRELAAPALRLQLLHRLADMAQVGVDELHDYLALAAAERDRADHGATPAPHLDRAAHGAMPHPGPAGQPARRRASGHDASWSGRRAAGERVDRAGYRASGAASRASKPDLEQRARLLLALHPLLAREIEAATWLPAGLADWLAAMAQLPAGAGIANVFEWLRQERPQGLRQLEAALARDPAALAELRVEEARDELGGALRQLRLRDLDERIAALVRDGIRSDTERERYLALMAEKRGA